MALNIPINLMSVAAPPAPQSNPTADPSTAVGGTAAVQPAAAGANTRGASTNGGSSFGQGTLAQQLRANPDKAEAKSVISAQLPSNPSAAAGPQARRNVPQQLQPNPFLPEAKEPEQIRRRASEIDRYAPPDPLPTAPILMAASSYRAASRPG